jgi:GAF domain-containing protein
MPDPLIPPRRGHQAPSWPSPDVAAAISSFVDRGPFGVAVFDTDLRFILVSQGLAALHGQEASETVGKCIDEILPRPFADMVAAPLRRSLETGIPILDVDTWGTFADPSAERSFTSSFYRLDDAAGTALGVVVLITETTELRYAEAAAQAAADQLELLDQVTKALAGGDTVADVIHAALPGAAQAVGASAALLLVCNPNDETLARLASTGLHDETLAALGQTVSLDAAWPHTDSLRSRTITLWASRLERDAEYPALAALTAEHQSWAFVPLLAHDRPIGVVVFAWRLDRTFGPSDVALIGAVGRQCALALEQSRLLDAERQARRAMEFLVEVTKFVVEGLDAGVLALTNGNRILTYNQRFCELTGIPAASIVLGTDASSLLDATLALVNDPATVTGLLAAARERPSETLEADFDCIDGRTLASTSSPIRDRHDTVLGRVWYLRDETVRRAQEAEHLQALDQLLASHEHQAFLLQAAEIISQADGYGETLESLAQVAVPVLADLCLVDALTVDGGVVRMAARHADPALQSLVDELGIRYSPDPAGPHPSIDVMTTGRPRWSDTMTDDFLRRTSRDDDHYALLKRLHFTSYMTLPLVADNQILGSITLVSAGSGRRFGPADLALADEFTSRVAQVVAAAHRNDAARHAAHTLQASLLPAHLPVVPGLTLAVRYLPATVTNNVGGDFYDVISSPGGLTTVVIGDVAGHDMTAAAVMGKVRTALRILAAQAAGPRHFIEMLRHGWDNLELERMTTLLIASLDASTGQLRIASAGHPPPLLVDSGAARFLDVVPTTPLGAPASEITEWRGTLDPGATLLLFTDGLVEDHHRTFEDGAAALLAAASAPGGPVSGQPSGADSDHGEPGALCDRILEALVPDEAHHDDDVAIVSILRHRLT